METDRAFAEIFGQRPDWLGLLAGWESSPGTAARPGTFKPALHCDLVIVEQDAMLPDRVCEFQCYYDSSVWVRADLARLLRWREINSAEQCRRREYEPRRVEALVVFGERPHVSRGCEDFPHIRWLVLSERLEELELEDSGRSLASLLRPVFEAADEKVEERAPSDYRRLRDDSGLDEAERDCFSRIFVQFLMQRFRTRSKEEIQTMIAELVPVEETRAGRELIELGIERGLEEGMEKGIEKGIERGIEKGIERGIEKGIDEVLFALLERVCGSLGDELRKRLEDLPVSKAKALAVAVLDFRGHADLDAWLDANG